ncbi:MAG: glycosyltransferase [Flavobacteriales bacterium]|nr:MAG: glycosyltransferase [Flavobacteriales bacterium]
MKPKVLAFIDWYTPGYKAGGPVRSMVNMVDHLSERIDFHIVTSDTEYTETTPYSGITPDRWTTLVGGEHVWYASTGGTNKGAWKRLLEEQEWSCVYVNGLYSRWFSIMPLWLLNGGKQRRVVAPRGMLASGMMEHGRFKKRAFLAGMRTFGCYKGVEFQATNAEEEQDIRHWLEPDGVVHSIPNLGRMPVAHSTQQRAKVPGELKLLSVARIAKEKNTLFAIQCLRGLTGGITFDLYGPIYDEDYWRQCQEAMAQLPPNVHVSHKGTAHPEEVPGLMDEYDLLFMPSQGENFGHTMAEALARGLPLLISNRTPWKGLEAAHAGWDLPLDDRAAFVKALHLAVELDELGQTKLRDGALAMAARYLAAPEVVERTARMLIP